MPVIIVAVSAPAAQLLGYVAGDELVGHRLVDIIPERYRQAHLAGFTLHLFSGRSPLLGHQVTVPALRQDGSEVTIDISRDADVVRARKSAREMASRLGQVVIPVILVMLSSVVMWLLLTVFAVALSQQPKVHRALLREIADYNSNAEARAFAEDASRGAATRPDLVAAEVQDRRE